ncbi:MAG: hypothetical protein IOD05_08875 [Rhodobacter sp.]|nr:hypothetical protein [Rhodobacter sp.]MCA3493590.1 hypothetical protein [Rhodobacter sp.]MCA3500592.1 hypothetical protein [Rhodobacter sp.]MCA3503346.1 hypothetical protein [Rhodobacter sp.]MCA3515462.1 hypothetical protein [Rhodobacter sp.]
MRSVNTIIKYDGPALSGRSMDVVHLAPALLALSDLVKDANRYANGDRAGAKVLVNADLEQKCFELNVEILLTFWEQAKLLIYDENVRSAKEIAEWIGIVSGVGSTPIGLFLLIKRLKGKKVHSTVVLRVKDGQNEVEITVDGDAEPIRVKEAVYQLYANVETRRKALAVLEPLREDGYETLEFYEKEGVFVHLDKADVPAHDGSDLPDVVPRNVHVSTIRAGVKIRRAVYEGRSRWTVMYKKAVEVIFDDTAWLDAFQRGEVSAPPGSYLDADLEETYVTNENGEIVGDATYKVKKVHGVTLPPEQHRLDFKDDDPA